MSIERIIELLMEIARSLLPKATITERVTNSPKDGYIKRTFSITITISENIRD